MKNKFKNRDWNADLIRCVAVFSVICVHFFLNTRFYEQKIVGNRMMVAMIVRTAFMICVPLFIILTGYLMKDKKLTKTYYKGIIRTLEVYVIASIFCIIFKIIYFDHNYTIISGLCRILDYEGAKYAWYIEMYIGLFLLIPFLNILWNNLKDKKQKKWLILTLIILTTLPSILNIFNITNYGHLVNGNHYKTDKLVPEFFYDMYPITYYYIGAYLKENKIKFKPKSLAIVFIYCVILFGVLNYFMNYNKSFDNGIYADWGGFQSMIMTIVMFILLLNIKLDKPPKWLQFMLINISKLSLGIYLLSYIPDRIIYLNLLKHVDSSMMLLEYFVLIVITIFIISTLLSLLVEIIVKGINWICSKVQIYFKNKDLRHKA